MRRFIFHGFTKACHEAYSFDSGTERNFAQTFMLAMAERRLDTCPIEGFDEYRVRRLLGLLSGARVSLIVSCGYRTERGVWGERFRLPFEEVYHQI
ncbi:MAG: nitroreductase family protein [Porphyromonas sp.]|nr:nitroreductase family protein [Porphyromonas sp.]